jgi:D-alanyl-lipoteichoic acid acyltransferase DltB (MBOAT superfamily)
VNTTSIAFLAFTLIGAVAYNLNRSLRWRQLVLLALNLCFLGTFSRSPASFLPLGAFVLVGFTSARLMQVGYKSLIVPLICLEIAALVWLKKYSFLPPSTFLQFAYTTIGMSYICFRMLHLLVDAKDGAVPEVTLVSYLNYTLGFLTLVAGPVQRYQEFVDMQNAQTARRPALPDVGRAVERVALGFFKASIVAFLFSALQSKGISQLAAATSTLERVTAGLAVVASYPIFLYMNFSGYMDIVIGLGYLFGFTLPENFNRPFASTNFMIFWSRWHITVSDFFRTYMFNPLLMALMRHVTNPRIEPYLPVVAFFLTFTVLGIWHGQSSVFVAYGLALGFGISANKLYQLVMIRRMGQRPYRQLSKSGLYAAMSRGLSFTYYTFCLLFFWSSWPQLRTFWGQLDSASLAGIWIGLVALASVLLALAEAASTSASAWRVGSQAVLSSKYVRTAATTAVVVITVAITAMLNAPAPENVYRAF